MINANKLYEVQTHVMLTGHMQNVLPVFINERVWQSISEKDRNAILDGLDGIAQDTLRQAQKAEQDLIGELQKKGMTFVTEKDGLKLADFRERVSAEVNKDFPTWKAYMDRIAAVK
jgi:TRAP-type C4-dicarboxylate transport system substrate-binding protein